MTKAARRVGAALVLALALALAGCGRDPGSDGIATAGGPDGGPSASPTGPSEENMQERMLAYAQCMRENGIPDFPDPDFSDNGRGMSLRLPEGTDAEKVDAANQKCRQHMPNGGEPGQADPEMLERLRKFAQCMRDNGFPDFPDPGDGGLMINGNEHPEWGPDNPEFVAAQEACRQYAPGRPGEGPRTQTGGGA
jgi:hypothetical protein